MFKARTAARSNGAISGQRGICCLEDMRPSMLVFRRSSERCCLDFAAPMAAENSQRHLGGGCGEFAHVRHRRAANFAFGRGHDRRWVSGTGHRCRRHLGRNRCEFMKITARKNTG
jgi:hypothetical protein